MDEETTIPSPTDAYDGLPTISVIRVIVFLIICTFGLLANMVVIFLVLVLKEYKKSVTHWYVMQLAIADSIFLMSLPFQASEDLNEAWIYSIWLCKAKDAVLFINYYASIMFLMIMSIDRYIAVCHHYSNRLQSFRKQKSALIITACVWVIAILLSIPIMLYGTTAGIEPNCRCTAMFPYNKNYTADCLNQGTPLEECEMIDHTITCHKEENGDYYLGNGGNGSETSGFNFEEYFEQYGIGNGSYDEKDFIEEGIAEECHYLDRPSGWIAFIVFNFIAMFIVPFVVMIICYGLIIRNIKSVKQSVTRSRKGSSKSDDNRKRITLMCAMLVMTFALCWILFHALHISKIRGIQTSHGNSCVIATTVSIILAYLNSVLNPFLYSCMGSELKQKLKSLQSVPAMKPLIAMTSLNSKAKRKAKDRTRSKSSGETGKFSNERDLSSSQNPSTMVTKAVISKVSEA